MGVRGNEESFSDYTVLYGRLVSRYNEWRLQIASHENGFKQEVRKQKKFLSLISTFLSFLS